MGWISCSALRILTEREAEGEAGGEAEGEVEAEDEAGAGDEDEDEAEGKALVEGVEVTVEVPEDSEVPASGHTKV